jgi:3-phenylpropionate/cinnamic acid dioxygenase small subunit
MNTSQDPSNPAGWQARLQRLEDEAAIRDVLAEQGRHSDARRLEEWVGQFVEDCTFEVTGRRREEGIAAVRTSARQRMEGQAATGQTRHVITGTVVRVDGDSAHARSCFTVVTWGPAGPAVTSTGVYDDGFVRTPGGWKFQSRRATVDGSG